MFGFCFDQSREYFLCNFSETQKQQKIENWHCGILLIGYFWKMHKNATKCNKTISKWCKNKHGASKIIDTFETYQTTQGLGSTTSPQTTFVLGKSFNKHSFQTSEAAHDGLRRSKSYACACRRPEKA
jgi:hypothetical protein